VEVLQSSRRDGEQDSASAADISDRVARRERRGGARRRFIITGHQRR